MNILIAEDLKKVYGSKKGGNIYKALDGVSFEIESGEFLGIMGPSGAGKTTLLNMIATIDKPTSGSINIGGEDIVNLKEPGLSIFRRNKLGFIFQDFNLLDTMTLKENIILPSLLSKKDVRKVEKKLEDISAMLGISHLLEKYPYQVSGGEKQRAAAARAMINEPELILADEPTGALDSKSSRELLECMSDLNKNNNATIMMVTHDAFSASYCNRIIFIKDGRIFTEIARSGSRKNFFNKILDVLSAIGGDVSELL